MGEKAKEGLEKQQIRRARINRIKMGIVCSVFIWMLLSMIMCVILFVKVHSLETKLDILTRNEVSTTQIDQPENGAPNMEEYGMPATEVTELAEGMESAEGMGSKSVTANVISTSDSSNLAAAGEEYKVYLTFDDGPSSNTPEILDILDQYGIKATFFVVGKEDQESKALYRRIVNEGHTLGMHSYSHKYSVLYGSLEGFEEDFTRIRDLLYDVTGENCTLYRFPGGSSNRVGNIPMEECISYLNQQGITYFDWNVSSGDAACQAYTAEELVENVLSDVIKYKSSVVLMHDSETKEITVESLPAMIEALNGLEAQILPIDGNTTAIQHITADSVQ